MWAPLYRVAFASSQSSDFSIYAQEEPEEIFTSTPNEVVADPSLEQLAEPDPLPFPTLPIPPKKISFTEAHFKAFIEIFDFFIAYINGFDRSKDKNFSSIGDFKATFIQRLLDKYPAIELQVDAYRASSVGGHLTLKAEGGGAGIRVNINPTEHLKVAFLLMPAYGEKRKITDSIGKNAVMTDLVIRANVGTSLTYEISDIVESGIQLFFQPHVLDPNEYKVYLEAFARFNLWIQKKRHKNLMKVQKVVLMPKFVYWHTNDDFENLHDFALGKFSYQVATHMYGFLNLVFYISI